MKPCDAARILLEAVKPEKGGTPGFKAFHALRALEASMNEPGIGRPRLQSLLGLGEAATRTLIIRLVEAGLVEKASRGIKPSSLGIKVLETLRNRLTVEETIESIVDEWGQTILAIIAVEPPTSLTQVYRVRDYLVEEGCKTAVIGGLVDGSVKLPGAPEYLEARVDQVLPEKRPLTATIIIVPSTCRNEVVNAALRLLAETCKRYSLIA